MQPIVFKVLLFEGLSEQVHTRSEKSLLWLLEALCQINMLHLGTGKYPRLHESGVRYQAENGTEEWLDVPNVLLAGWGDCEDLASWRCAELRLDGVHCSPYVRYRLINGAFHYHCLVELFDVVGTKTVNGVVVPAFRSRGFDDPSLDLGMGRDQADSFRDGVEGLSSGMPWPNEPTLLGFGNSV